VLPVGMVDGAEEGDADAGDLVDDYEAGVFAAAFAGGDGGGGDAEAMANAMPVSVPISRVLRAGMEQRRRR
jgi:hypothetical protein